MGEAWDSKFILFFLLRSFFRPGNREANRGPASWRGFDPDAAAVPIDDLLAYRQTYARAGIFSFGMKALKEYENTLGVLLRNADSVVTN